MAAKVEALTNPILARFLVAEMTEHRARVEAEANGSLLVEPRMTVVAQFVNQLCEANDIPKPGIPARREQHGEHE